MTANNIFILKGFLYLLSVIYIFKTFYFFQQHFFRLFCSYTQTFNAHFNLLLYSKLALAGYLIIKDNKVQAFQSLHLVEVFQYPVGVWINPGMQKMTHQQRVPGFVNFL